MNFRSYSVLTSWKWSLCSRVSSQFSRSRSIPYIWQCSFPWRLFRIGCRWRLAALRVCPDTLPWYLKYFSGRSAAAYLRKDRKHVSEALKIILELGQVGFWTLRLEMSSDEMLTVMSKFLTTRSLISTDLRNIFNNLSIKLYKCAS